MQQIGSKLVVETSLLLADTKAVVEAVAYGLLGLQAALIPGTLPVRAAKIIQYVEQVALQETYGATTAVPDVDGNGEALDELVQYCKCFVFTEYLSVWGKYQHAERGSPLASLTDIELTFQLQRLRLVNEEGLTRLWVPLKFCQMFAAPLPVPPGVCLEAMAPYHRAAYTDESQDCQHMGRLRVFEKSVSEWCVKQLIWSIEPCQPSLEGNISDLDLPDAVMQILSRRPREWMTVEHLSTVLYIGGAAQLKAVKYAKHHVGQVC